MTGEILNGGNETRVLHEMVPTINDTVSSIINSHVGSLIFYEVGCSTIK